MVHRAASETLAGHPFDLAGREGDDRWQGHKAMAILATHAGTGKAAGYASRVVKHFPLVAKPGMAVVLFVRESGRVQEWAGHLKDQEAHLKRLIEPFGVRVARTFRPTCHGSDTRALAEALDYARDRNAIVVAESTARLLRAVEFSPKEPDRVPTKEQWRELKRMARGVVVATWVKPDATPEQVRAFESEWGLACKGRKRGQRRKRRERPRNAGTGSCLWSLNCGLVGGG
jgi:hypothetical protein